MARGEGRRARPARRRGPLHAVSALQGLGGRRARTLPNNQALLSGPQLLAVADGHVLTLAAYEKRVNLTTSETPFIP